MIKAGALYFSITTAFFIAVISASLIILAAYYRSSYLKELRLSRLQSNLQSGILYALEAKENQLSLKLDLFEDGRDTVIIEKSNWGIFSVAKIRPFIFGDTISKCFLMAIPSEKDSVCLYLSDEDRPVSVSGDTRIVGNAQLPKSGIRKAYAEGRPYLGKQEVFGKVTDSKRNLPSLDPLTLDSLDAALNISDVFLAKLPPLPSTAKGFSFLGAMGKFKVSVGRTIETEIDGQVVIYSNTTVYISNTAKLSCVIIYAPAIIVQKGFSGNCQLFAKDSIIVEEQVRLKYPSVLGLLSKNHTVGQGKISIGENCEIHGIIFSHEKKRSALQTLISIGKSSFISGQVYASGMISLYKGAKIYGSAFCNRFIMRTPATFYENFLIDVELNIRARNRYFLSAPIFGNRNAPNKILEWLH